jgi:hypothetical protein
MGRKTWKWYSQTRNAILANCNERCVACGCADEAVLEMDHIVPAGPTTVANGQAMCGPCNRAKADVVHAPALTAYPQIDRTMTVAEYLAEIAENRQAWRTEMDELRKTELVSLVGWARSEIGDGRRIASVIRSIARRINVRTSKQVARSL